VYSRQDKPAYFELYPIPSCRAGLARSSLGRTANMNELTLHNSIREKMLRDEVAYILSVKLVRSVELPMMAKTAGFDGILIDMEHSTFDLDTTSTSCSPSSLVSSSRSLQG
jgi:hypothetical protein